MGRASSNKKVARAAGTGGGRTSGRRVPWSYYGVIALVVVLGLVGTVVSRQRRENQVAQAGTVQPTVGGTPWNEAFAVYECGKFAPNITVKSDPHGIRSQGDGIIHISPKTKSVAGKNATLGVYTSAVGMTLSPAEVKLPGGKAYNDGDTCEGGKGHVYVKQFPYAGAPTGTLLKGDPGEIRLADQEELVVAFVPSSKSKTIPAPPADVVANLKKLAASTSTTTTTVPGVTTTVPGAATTTVPGASTTTPTATTVAPSTATTVAPSTATTVAPSTATTK
jgi:hypothetical protein